MSASLRAKMSPILVRSVPKRGYWFMGIWLYPIAGFIFTAILLVPVYQLIGRPLPRTLLLGCWVVFTLAISAWAYTRDYRRMHYTLTSDTLIFGRGRAATVIPFAEIVSIVLGLPDRLPWWIQIQRFAGGPGAFKGLAAHWKSVPVLRLSGSRYLPLDVGSGRMFLNGFDFLVAQLLELNKHKIVGRDSYTERETNVLRRARYNTIKRL